jgi:hypothetical protein
VVVDMSDGELITELYDYCRPGPVKVHVLARAVEILVSNCTSLPETVRDVLQSEAIELDLLSIDLEEPRYGLSAEFIDRLAVSRARILGILKPHLPQASDG